MFAIGRRLCSSLLRKPQRAFAYREDEIINQYTTSITPDELCWEKKRPMKRTKIVCTIG